MRVSLIAKFTAAAAAVALLATGCGSSSADSQQDLTKVKIGYIADYNGAALLAVADQEGYWKDAGLDPDYIPFTNGPLAIQALGTGNIDVGYIGSGALWLPAQGKAEIWAVNSVSNADRIVAQPGISSMKDLKGKKIGVPAGTSGDLLLNLALDKAGMKRSDLNVVNMDPSTAVSAFASNQIDAAALWYPLIDTLKERRPTLVELAGNKDFMPADTFPSTFVAQSGRAEKDPKLARSVISVIKQANDFRYENQDSTIKATATFLKLKPAVMKAQADVATIFTSKELEKDTKDGTVAGWFSGLEKQFMRTGKLDKIADPKDFYRAKDYLDAAND